MPTKLTSKVLSKLMYDTQNPEDFVPHGDRLFVQKYEIEDAVYVDHMGDDGTQTKIVIQRAIPPRNPRDPTPEMTSEQLQEVARGWILCRIVGVGDGHRLELDMKVPMPFEKGDFVYVERLAGRELDFFGVKYHVISQIDVLLHNKKLTTAFAQYEKEEAAKARPLQLV